MPPSLAIRSSLSAQARASQLPSAARRSLVRGRVHMRPFGRSQETLLAMGGCRGGAQPHHHPLGHAEMFYVQERARGIGLGARLLTRCGPSAWSRASTCSCRRGSRSIPSNHRQRCLGHRGVSAPRSRSVIGQRLRETGGRTALRVPHMGRRRPRRSVPLLLEDLDDLDERVGRHGGNSPARDLVADLSALRAPAAPKDVARASRL
jgi:GNAT superfamily N-acetyltransferase